MTGKISSYRDLIVWQKSIILVKDIYLITKSFPKDELYGIVSQIRSSAISVPCNIAEGSRRSTKKEYVYFLRVSLGSISELETQIEISKVLSYLDQKTYEVIMKQLSEVGRMLNALISSLTKPT